ncbi:hypothetical protein BN1356_00920 [Streptococcus varani]|uniref:Uncharacterized protein n=1 Tax=Streptococcus varani TaxID=1608583 RepID=A0A0E4CSI4_9STRE|nr:hypothetical protein BN1356_00920 [Streptococcus varani]
MNTDYEHLVAILYAEEDSPESETEKVVSLTDFIGTL